MNFGFAAIRPEDRTDPGVGWALTANGQIQRAVGAVDRVSRLLRPLFGGVWSEPHRGNAVQTKRVDAIKTILVDRVHLVLSPMIESGEIGALAIDVADSPANPKYLAVRVSGVDRRRERFELSEFVRIGE